MDIISISQKKNSSSSMKKLFKQIFKSKKTVAASDSMESFESLENSRNASLESSSDCGSMESYDNDINESYEKQEEFDYPTTVPVHFVRTEQGTFFWTSAAYMQDRWAQA
ncbi:enhancer of split m4 protein-like [Musca domestica]|uniref:Enhancer of split m4 protein-like n=2 Tax=Musca domestica TaxID=7370 RepID=A0ABM3VR58_MUSDO|nr:enhancer of split m4 protein-like [Musca domestica]